MNTFQLVKAATGEVIIYATNEDRTLRRNLNAEEANALNGLLNEQEFEQHITQQPIVP